MFSQNQVTRIHLLTGEYAKTFRSRGTRNISGKINFRRHSYRV